MANSYVVQPNSAVYQEPDNRIELRFYAIAGDGLDPEYTVKGGQVAWLSNRVELGFQKVAQ